MPNPKSALIIVDVQNDFCPGGALAVPNGDQVVEPLNRAVEYAETNSWLIMASRDWHPRKTAHFAEFGGKWPVHCVQYTHGAEFHPFLHLPPRTIVVSKGMSSQDDGYSLFEGLYLRASDWPLWPDILLACSHEAPAGYRELYIGGLATDYCVKATALDAVKREFKAYLLLDACRAVNVNPGDGDRAIDEMFEAGVIITNTAMVLNGEEPRSR